MKTGRNDPCPCGSGLKYKKCCAAKDEADRIAQNAALAAAQVPQETPLTHGSEFTVSDPRAKETEARKLRSRVPPAPPAIRRRAV